MLKKLNQFRPFQWNEFAKDKKLVVTGIRPWEEYENRKPTGRRLGASVEVVIVEDGTHYETKEGESVTNLYEKLTVKVPDQNAKFPVGTVVATIGEVTATVYGEFQNRLSVKAAGLKTISNSAKPPSEAQRSEEAR